MSRYGPPPFVLRLGAEFIVIVIGVLTALWVEGWSQERAAMRNEEDYLASLESDFVRNLEIANDMESIHADAAQRARLLLETVDANGAPDLAYDSLVALVEFAGWNTLRPFVWDTWDDMIATGNSDLLSDAELRQRIQGVFNAFQRVELMESEWYEYQQSYREVMREVVPWSDRLTVSNRVLHPDSTSRVSGDSQMLVRSLREVEGIRGRLSELALAHRSGTVAYRSLAGQVEEILSRIDGRPLLPE